MPEQMPLTKIAKTQAYRADVLLTGKTLEESKKIVDQFIEAYGYLLIDPYDDLNIIWSGYHRTREDGLVS